MKTNPTTAADLMAASWAALITPPAETLASLQAQGWESVESFMTIRGIPRTSARRFLGEMVRIKRLERKKFRLSSPGKPARVTYLYRPRV